MNVDTLAIARDLRATELPAAQAEAIAAAIGRSMSEGVASKADVAAILQKIDSLGTKIEAVQRGFEAKIESSERTLGAKLETVERGIEAKIKAVERVLEAKIEANERALEVKVEGAERGLEAKIEAVERGLGGRIEAVDAQLTSKIDNARFSILAWLMGVILATAGIVIAVLKYH